MLINVTRSLQLVQWSSYVAIAFLVQLVIIFPLSVLLFHDFYVRLLPPDSSQWIPLSAFNNTYEMQFQQVIIRTPPEYPLPTLLDNGLPQGIPLRDHILYKMDIDVNLYCLKDSWDEGHNLDSVQLQVYTIVFDDELELSTLVYRRTIPVVCLKTQDSISVDDIYKVGPNRLLLFEKEWLNHITIEDNISVGPEAEAIQYVFSSRNESDLIFDPKSSVRLIMNFEQGFRNLMLRWRLLSHIIGTTVFFIVITILFALTGAATFYFINSKSVTSNKGPKNL